MKKLNFRLLGALLVIVAVAFAVSFAVRTTRNVRIDIEIGTSDRFTYEEIVSAMKLVQETFAERFYQRDRIVMLEYDEEFANRLFYPTDYDKNNTILVMSHYVQRNPHYSGQRGMGWILVREEPSAPWMVYSGPFPGVHGH